MKFLTKISIILVLVVAACNNENKTAATVKTDTTQVIPPVISDTIKPGCYSQLVGRDTSLLQVQGTKGSVTGTLSYNIFEKDRNDGSFQGEMTDDLLMGWYLFKSEGTMSVRQVAWKIQRDQLWQGIGEMTEKGDTMRYVNAAALKFDSTRPFKKVECVL